jgi:hypothetical protein
MRGKRREITARRRLLPTALPSEPASGGKTGFFIQSLTSPKKGPQERCALRISPKSRNRHFPALFKTAAAETGVFFWRF